MTPDIISEIYPRLLPNTPRLPNGKWFIIAVIVAVLVICFAVMAHASEYPNDHLANAIYFAEGGTKTTHPYGILVHYKHTNPRQACLNTIKSAKRRYEKTNKRMDFIQYLSLTYCPIGAVNDPRELNKNWVRNVNFYLRRQK